MLSSNKCRPHLSDKSALPEFHGNFETYWESVLCDACEMFMCVTKNVERMDGGRGVKEREKLLVGKS